MRSGLGTAATEPHRRRQSNHHQASSLGAVDTEVRALPLTTDAGFIMGALLSLPLLALPSVGTVRSSHHLAQL